MTNELIIEAPAGLPFIDATREFDAPAAAVFAAHADPELVRQWLGPRGYEMDVQEYDFRSGGRYRYLHRSPAGAEFGFRGTFHTIRPDELAIQTFEYEGVPDVVSIESMTLEALPGVRTRLRVHAVYPSLQARDAILANGMENGMREGYEQLDDLLERQPENAR